MNAHGRLGRARGVHIEMHTHIEYIIYGVRVRDGMYFSSATITAAEAAVFIRNGI